MLDHATFNRMHYLSFDLQYYVFNYDTGRAIEGRHTLRITPNDDVKTDSASLFRPSKSLRVVFKAAVSTENSVIDRSRIASVVTSFKFCSLKHLIRAKKRPNTIN